MKIFIKRMAAYIAIIFVITFVVHIGLHMIKAVSQASQSPQDQVKEK